MWESFPNLAALVWAMAPHPQGSPAALRGSVPGEPSHFCVGTAADRFRNISKVATPLRQLTGYVTVYAEEADRCLCPTFATCVESEVKKVCECNTFFDASHGGEFSKHININRSGSGKGILVKSAAVIKDSILPMRSCISCIRMSTSCSCSENTTELAVCMRTNKITTDSLSGLLVRCFQISETQESIVASPSETMLCWLATLAAQLSEVPCLRAQYWLGTSTSWSRCGRLFLLILCPCRTI